MRSALECLHEGWGKACIIGVCVYVCIGLCVCCLYLCVRVRDRARACVIDFEIRQFGVFVHGLCSVHFCLPCHIHPCISSRIETQPLQPFAGVAPPGQEVATRPFQLVCGKVTHPSAPNPKPQTPNPKP